MNKFLTKKQKQVLLAIEKLSKNNTPPTLREVQEYLGYGSISSVQRHTEALKKKGIIQSDKHQARNLKIQKSFTQKFNIPLVGSIPCGTPFLAVQNIEAYIPFGVKGDPKEYFFLRAIGDSMNKTGINDGDLVLVKKQQTADSGDKVVALIGDEATIKIFKQDRNKIILEPRSTNPEHKPIYVFDNLQVQGIVIDKIKIN